MKRMLKCSTYMIPALLFVLPIQMASASTVVFGAADHSTITVPETYGQLSLKFRLTNYGPTSIAITGVTETVTPVSGDTLLDGLMASSNSGCSSVILPGKWCTVDAKFTVVDADPGDSFNPVNETGNWTARVSVTYHDVGVSPVQNFTVSDERSVAVSDTPEPATWAFMISGLALTGGIMRRRKAKAVLTA